MPERNTDIRLNIYSNSVLIDNRYGWFKLVQFLVAIFLFLDTNPKFLGRILFKIVIKVT